MMQNFGGNPTQGALSPSGSSLSGSSVRSPTEVNQMQPKSNLISENASMDYCMRNLELKMQGKREELKTLLEEKASNLSALENLKKQLTLLQDRESSLASALTTIRDSNTMSEDLETAVNRNLKAIQISNEEQKSKWEKMIKEYTEKMNSQREIYSSFPWVMEKKKLAEQVEKKRIFLLRLKLKEDGNKAQQAVFDKISEERMKSDIVRLSQLMVERNCESMKSDQLKAQKKILYEEIKTLEREQKEIEDYRTLRTQEMMRRIVERSNAKQNAPPPEPTGEPKVAPMISSIRERLGINKKEFKGTSVAESLRDRLFGIKRLSPAHGPNDASQLPAPSLPKPYAVVSSPPARDQHPQSSQEADGPTSPPAMDKDFADLRSEPAIEMRRESETTLVASATSDAAARVELRSASSLPEVTVPSVASRLVSLKAILKPPASLVAKKPVVSSQTSLPSVTVGLPPAQPNEFSSAPTALAFPGQPQAIAEIANSSPEVSGTAEPAVSSSQQPFKRPTEVPQPPETEGLAEPKKSKVDGTMPPPPKSTRRPLKPKRSAETSSVPQPKPPKRVSFLTGSQSNASGSSQSINECSQGNVTQAEPVRSLKQLPSLPAGHQEVSSGQPKVTASQQMAAANENVTQGEGTEQAADQQPSPSGADDFPPPFASPPQPFSGPSPNQGTPGNFDSIFGAIFSSPQTPSNSMGFQFPLDGDAQKQNPNQGQSQPGAPPAGQDFFSFFSTPNTDNSKKSFSDNFFKLF